MRKLLVFALCLAVAAGYAFAGQTEKAPVKSSADAGVKIFLNGDSDRGALDEKGFEDDPDEGDADDRTFCTFPLCGSPAEDGTANSSCASPDPTHLYCGDDIYGRACETSDYFVVHVPAHTIAIVTLWDGTECSNNPAIGTQMKVYNMACDPISDYTNDNFEITNSGDTEGTVKLRVKKSGIHYKAYRVNVTCNGVPDPCPPGSPINYCENPIVIPAGILEGNLYHFWNSANSCCAARVVNCVGAQGCDDNTCYESGPDVIYQMNLAWTTLLYIEVGVDGGDDVQFMIFTDCNDPAGSCVVSRDAAPFPWTGPEVLSGLELEPGVYYISTSYYSDPNCGEIYIYIEGDHPLPVELTGFDAVAGDASVALNWTTASESNTDFFELVRDGGTVARVTASNSPAGGSYTWTDENVTNGRVYDYRLIAVGFDGNREELAAKSATPTFTSGTVTEYALHQNYPNPFNPETNISFDLVENGSVTLTVYNPLGQLVATLVNGSLAAGRHTIAFDGSKHTSGLYYYRLDAGDFSAIRKMVLMK